MVYNIRPQCYRKISSFYHNVAKKYKYTYSLELMQKNILEAYNSIYQIENGALRRTPTISRWSGYFMAHIDKWYFAYTITTDADGNVSITVVDSCHQQNMHESTSRFQNKIIENKQYNTMKNTRNRVRLTESQLHQVIKESVKKVLKEEEEEYGMFNTLSSMRHPEDGFYICYKGQYYIVPDDILDTFDFRTRDGRRAIVDAIRSGKLQNQNPVPGAQQGNWGYKQHWYNADAF